MAFAGGIFSWCLKQGLTTERNPCLGVERFPDRKRDRVLSAAEIKALWDATAGPDDYSAIVRLLLLSGCRASEISGLRWDEVYSDRIVLPAERTKNKRQHTLPLTATMRAIIEGRERRPGKEHIFGRPSNGGFSGGAKARPRSMRASMPRASGWCVGQSRFAKNFRDRLR